jgi:hypothetical protein
MAKKKSAAIRTTFTTLNIKIRQLGNKDSTPAEYADLFMKMANQKKKIRLASDLGGIIWRCQRERANGREIILGFITRYTIIESGKWLEIDNPEAEQTDVPIPAGMAANSRHTPFYFVPENHRLALRRGAKALTPFQAKLFFERAFKFALEPEQYIEIDIAPSEEQYNRILESKSLSRLDITLNFSNNDITDDFTAMIEEQIRNTKSRRWKIEAVSEDGELLDPSKSSVLQGALGAAKNNGTVEATEVSPTGKKKVIRPSTAPRTETITSELPSDLLGDVGDKLLQMYPRPTTTQQDE